MNLKDKVVIVTGSSSGIGEAAAYAFANEGAKVVVNSRSNTSSGKEVVERITKMGERAFYVQADVSNPSDAQILIEETIEKFGTVDILINNAGGYINGDEWEGESNIWEETLKQNLVSTMNVSKYAHQIMRKQKSGVIVNTASRHALSGQFDALAYAAAKAGVVNITQAYAKLMAPWGRANSVSPGAVRAGYWKTAPKNELEESLKSTPLKRLVEPEEIADTILYLVKNDAITGQNIVVDCGFLLK